MYYLVGIAVLCVLHLGLVDSYRGSDNRVVDHTNQMTRQNSRHYYGPDSYYSGGLYGDYNNYIVRHPIGHHYFQPSSSNDQNNDLAHVTGVVKSPSRRITTGLFRTSQRGTVKIPYMGANVRVPAMAGSRKAYRGTVTTTILTRQEARAINNHRNNTYYPIHDEPIRDVCVRCPKDKTVVASRGLNYVLMERSKVRHCHHSRHRVPGAKFERLYGPRKGMAVFEGNNVVLGRITYKHKVLQHCRYHYNVIVRKCTPLMPPKHVKVQCTAGSTWGSECQLSCTSGYQLHGHNTTECNDKLKWSKPLPYCTVITGCLLPMSPMHGQLKCHTSDSGESGELLPEGSMCHYACDDGYSVPSHQKHLLVIQCNAGEWNSTADPSCRPISALSEDDRLQPQVFSSDTVHHVVRMRHRRHKRSPESSESDNLCEPNPCHGNGTCTIDPHRKEAVCTCKPGRIGVYCETSLCGDDTCKNGGICVGMNRPNCMCPPGYGGVYCEAELCGYQICKNGGKCVNSNGTHCECPVGYSGFYCEVQDLG